MCSLSCRHHLKRNKKEAWERGEQIEGSSSLPGSSILLLSPGWCIGQFPEDKTLKAIFRFGGLVVSLGDVIHTSHNAVGLMLLSALAQVAWVTLFIGWQGGGTSHDLVCTVGVIGGQLSL